MADPIQHDIEKEAQKAIWQRALFRTQNAVLVGGSLLLAAFYPQPFPDALPWFDWWTWLLIGAIGVAAIIVSTVRDPKEQARAVAEMFREEHNPDLIKDKELRAKYERALEYYDRLEELALQMKSESMRSRFSESVRQMNEWMSNIYGLALRLQAYKADGILNRDRKQVPQTLQQLDAKIKLEYDDGVRRQLQSTRDAKWQQWQNLETLDNLMERSELQLDNSIAAMGTVYSQFLLISNSREVDGARARRLQEDVDDEVTSLQDLVVSINEVYDYRFEGFG